MASPLDKDVEFVRDLSYDGKLYRCLNAAGVPYSYIERKGKEFLNTEIKDDFSEAKMISYWESEAGAAYTGMDYKI